ncbi:MAG: YbaN family protein [Candidatus Dactylopiibacterium sp.]|nr:YbaN family protein [Candidatus Dactylopiibacterium sp.]
MTRYLWRLLAIVSLLLGVIGAFLPVLPTVPFVLLAAWAAGRGWPGLEAWLLAHPKWGPPIRDWRAHGAVSRRAKQTATLMMGLSAAITLASPLPLVLKVALPLFLLAVALWLWRRPER